MKIVKQTLLHYQKGTSNKVYNVYLVEIDGGFLVNFEYGRYGANLRKGTKTKSPVELERAQKLYDSLVVSKINKDYIIERGFDPLKNEQKRERDNISRDDYVALLLERLERAVRENLKVVDNYKLSRLIYRAGELRVVEAKNLAIEIYKRGLEKGNAIGYSTVFLLGRVGDESDLDLVATIGIKLDANSKYIVNTALSAINHRENSLSKSLSNLNLASISELASNHLEEDITKEINSKILNRYTDELEALERDVERLKASYDEIKSEEIEWGWGQEYWKRVQERYDRLNKIKEQILKKRLNITDTLSNLYLLSPQNSEFKKYIVDYLFKDEIDEYRLKVMLKKFYKIAYFLDNFELLAKIITAINSSKSIKTGYFKRRNLRLLKSFGMFEPTSYIDFSKEILLSLNGFEEIFKARTVLWHSWNYDTWEVIKKSRKLENFTHHPTATFIMRGKSKNLALSPYKKYWERVSKGEKSLKDIPFLELWRENLEVVLEILGGSVVEDVQDFALFIIKERLDFLESVDVELLLPMTNLINKEAREIFFEILKRRYQTDQDVKIAEAFLLSKYEDIYSFGIEILDSKPDILKESKLLTKILRGGEDRVFKESINRLKNLPNLSKIVDEVIAELIESEPDISKKLEGRLRELLSTLIDEIEPQTLQRMLAQESINPYLLIALEMVREGDFDISLEQKEHISQFDHPEITATMVFLLGKLDDKTLAKESKIVVFFLFDENKKVRNEAKKLIKRISKEYGAKILEYIAQSTFTSTTQDIEKDILTTAKYLKPHFKEFSRDIIYRLIVAKSKLSNRLGGEILSSLRPEDFSLTQWIRFAKNQNKRVRDWAFKAFVASRDRVEEAMPKPLEIFDTYWEDCRHFAREYFGEFDLSIDEVLIIADSNYEDVQLFAKELILQRAKESSAIIYALSQHPSAIIQRLSVDLILKEASDAHLLKLERFFHTVLLNVNRNRVAKTSILELLNSRLENRDIALLYAKLAKRHYRTIVKLDRANFIEAMYQIKSRFSDIELPIKIADDVEIKDAV